ncbi:uncharacterized protein LOC110655333 isoform X2 [Hevea brasiliensis]|uniref:uncharacterized protein LOC110655333 isoform X2 n=1 Tax=Hevea brasiliensis TaxID=3981 RepID=UPI0025D5D4B7|nr:uncharacterized protein LOC110655333 isoform X2 [Hevea brasiliensis]
MPRKEEFSSVGMDDQTSASDDDLVLKEEEDNEVEAREATNLVFKATYEAKLRELLHKINSFEIKLCSDATKEFVKLLKGNSGGELLRLYVQSTSNFSELVGALKLREGKPGMSYILSLISVILSHPDGKYKPNDKERIAISVVLDKFARSFIEEKFEVVYKELNSKEGKCQNAALLLMASIVRRGSGLASEVAKKFDFKLQAFSKLAEYKLRQNNKKRKHSTRRAFVEFAMSFLEVGKPGLLRWILQQREMFSGVLRGLENDDNETVIFVLSTLRDKILTEQSLVSPALRSVLFGSVVLEQLVGISGMRNGPSAELAHNVLLMVCTDPCNGLMPDFKRRPTPLRGNPKRLLELMKKLKATEIDNHRDLLLAIVRGSLSFGSAYMEEFPYNLEDYASPSWFSSVSLAANLVSSMAVGDPFGFIDFQSNDPPCCNSVHVQNIMTIISSRPLSRSVINKGLLHLDFLVKNGTLRLLLEALKLLDSFLRATSLSCTRKQRIRKWAVLKQEIWNEIRTLLPDPQVLLSLLSPLSSLARSDKSCLKRTADKEISLLCCKRRKKLKRKATIEDTDIIIGGINSLPDIALAEDDENVVESQIPHASDGTMDFMNVISELWGSDLCSVPDTTLKDAEILFQSKLLDALKIYLLIMPTALEGSFDFFMNLHNNPSELPFNILYSLLPLLVEYIRWSPGSEITVRTPPLMYKHLQPFLNLLIFSPSGGIKAQAYKLTQAAMSSTGAFDRNLNEIVAWILFLPGYSVVKLSVEIIGTEVLQNLSTAAISFLCDAISTIGNNLFRYWDAVRNHTYHLNEFKDVSPEFSPLVICVLQKCMRLLSSESGTFSLLEKSMISVYVCNTLKYLLQTQVDARLLAALIRSVLSEGLQDQCSVEWQPLKNLLLFSESILHQKAFCFFLIDEKDVPVDSSFVRALGEVRKILESGHSGEIAVIMKDFFSAIMCTTSDGLLMNFPTVMTISQHLHIPLPFLSSVFFHKQNFLAGVLKLWPQVFFPGLEKAVSMIDPQGVNDDVFAQETILDVDFDASEFAAAVAFGLFLRQAPFHVLFPAIISSDGPCLSESSKIKDVLMAKLSECTSEFVVSYLRLLLFWFYQIQLSYRIKPLPILREFAEICYVLLKHMLAQLSAFKPDSEDPPLAKMIQEVAEIIFCHPAVKASLTYPLSCDQNLANDDFSEGNSRDNLQAFLSFSQQRIHPIDHHVLDMLTTTFDYLLSSFTGKHCLLKVEDGVSKQLVKAFKIPIQKIYLKLKDKFDLCIRTEDYLPLLLPFYALHALMQFTSPFELFDLVLWIFDRFELNGLTNQKSCMTFAFSIAFCIAGDAFKMLSIYLQRPVTARALFYTFWEMEKKILDINLIEEIYFKICKFATNLKVDFAYSCLLEAVSAVYRQKYMQCDLLDALSLVLSRVIISTPVEILSHCIYGASKTKAKLLSLLVDISPLHLSVFGYLFLEILNEKVHLKGNKVEEACETSLSDEDFMLLLPSAFSYLTTVFMKFEKQFYKQFTSIPSFYSKILLSGFHNWKSFVSGYVFQENYDEFLPSSIEELVNLVDASLLGKAIKMLQCHFAFSGGMKMKERLKMFSSILTCSDAHDQLLDCDVDETEFYSLSQSLNLINRVVAKISLCRMMLFPVDNHILSPKEADGNSKSISLDMLSNKEGQSRMLFIKILVSTWRCLVKKFPSVSNGSRGEKSSGCLQLFRYLELFILRTVLELTTEMRGDLVHLQAIPFLEQLMRSSLLFRFEDPTTLDVLRSILTLLSEGKFSSALYIRLLLAHSQFESTICSFTESHSSQSGALFKPMPSILRSLDITHPNSNNDLQTTKPHLKQLEIVKLLRTLIQLKPELSGGSSGKESGINLKELHLLLLSSYGATLSEIDLEIYNLMQEIESIDKSVSEDLSEMDYLWGSAALKIRNERALDQDLSSNIMTDTEAFEEHRRSQFREILPIDPKKCLATVLHFPYDRIASDGGLLLSRFEPENLKTMHVKYSPPVDKIQRYDPIFILRFSIHILSMGYIEPVEFAGLGLLAVAFVSISSPDVGMRKLGYESLGRYKNALEGCQKKKDIMRLRLLLTYMQNGIKEPWQKIPSILALFAAESSLILLDPSNDHYTTLSKHLMHSSKVNMKCIPLFHTLFQSNSVNFRAERLWILRLACAGLNLNDDAEIFINNSILETLLSFYATPLADNESKELILQVVKKSVKLHRMTYHLVEDCGLFPWLSYIISISSGLLDEKNSFSTLQLVVAVKVASDIISFRDINQWLQDCALEQLMELSSNLYKLLVGGLELIKENVSLIDSILQIMTLTLKISQKRKIYQPHFTLSMEGLFRIYQTLDACDTSRSSSNAEFGLQTILMSTPPVDIFYMNKEKLSGFLMWALSTALKSDSLKIFHHKVSLMIISEETPSDETLISKLLRWLVAAVILGKLYWKLNDVNSKYSEKSSSKSLQSFLEYVEMAHGGRNNCKFDCEEVLAATIIFLQQLIGSNSRVLSSVVSALCLCGPFKHSGHSTNLGGIVH